MGKGNWERNGTEKACYAMSFKIYELLLKKLKYKRTFQLTPLGAFCIIFFGHFVYKNNVLLEIGLPPIT